MAYAVLQDVKDRLPQFDITPTSRPNETQATAFLSDAEVELDASLGNLGYVVPVTGPRSLQIVKTLTCYAAIAKILKARAAAAGGEAAVASAARAKTDYDDAIAALADPNNPFELPDTVRSAKQLEKPGSIVVDGLLTDDDGNELEPRATMSQEF